MATLRSRFLGIFTVAGFLTFLVPSSCFAVTQIYYSVGQNTTDHKTGSPTITIDGSGNATFSVAQTAVNMGIGDVITYGGSKVYITGKTSTTVWTVETATGTLPVATTSASVTSVAHAFSSLKNAVGIGVANNATSTSLLNTSDLTSGNYVLNVPLYFDTGPDTTSVNISGFTTSSTNYLNIFTPTSTASQANQSQRHSGSYNTSKWAIEVTNPNAIIDVGSGNVHLDGLQVKYTQTSSTANGIRLLASSIPSGGEIWLSDSIIRGVMSGGTGAQGLLLQSFASGSRTAKIWNNIFYGFELGVTSNFNAISINTSWTAYMDNNTFWDNLFAINRFAGTGAAYNNLISSTTNPTSGFNGSISSDYNSTDSSSLGTGNGGLHNRVSQTFSFTSVSSPSSADFHLLSSDTGAKDLGVDISASSTLAFAYDIDGNTRPQGTAWDIGVDEVALTTGSVTTSAATSIGQNSATLNGNIASIGGANATIRGFNYGTSVSYGSISSTTGSYGTGAYSAVLTGLACGVTYHFQAFIVNSFGMSTGSDQAFTTTACAPQPYYVDYVGGSDANDGVSTTTAWQHAPGDASATGIPAGKILQAGDTIVFKGGVEYLSTIVISQSGTSLNPITYDGNSAGTWGAGKAILNGGNVDSDSRRYGFFSSSAVSYISIKNFEFKLFGGHASISPAPSAAVKGYGVSLFGDHITVQDSYFHDIGDWENASGMDQQYMEGVGAYFGTGTTTNVTVSNSEFTHIGRAGVEFDNHTSATNLTMTGLNIHDYVRWGIELVANAATTTMQDVTIDGVTVHDDYQYAADTPWLGVSAANPHFDGIILFIGNTPQYTGQTLGSTAHPITVKNSLFYNNSSTADDAGTAEIFATTWGGTLNIYNNVFLNTLSHGFGSIYFQDGVATSSGSTYPDYHVYNNTFVDSRNMVTIRTLASSTPVTGGDGNGKVYIDNNIFYKTDTGSSYSIATGFSNNTYADPTELDYNIYVTARPDNDIADMFSTTTTTRVQRTLSQLQAIGYEIHGQQVDPKFVSFVGIGANSSSNDVRLQSSSPAIDAGKDLSAYFTTDYLGVTRPQGTAWDIGAYEYAAITSPTVTTSSATGITASGASLNGSISAINGSNVTQSGFAYSIDQTLSSGVSTSTLGAQTGTASFNQSLASLSCNTTYYFRAYATNTGGTGYGSSASFTTSSCPVTPTQSTPVPVVSGLGGGFASAYTAPIFAPGYAPKTAVDTEKPVSPSVRALLASLPAITRPADVGTQSVQVKSIQTILNSLGFTVARTGPGSPGHETTYFGSLTTKAVEAFQLYYSLATPKDSGFGYVGPKTRAKMSSLVK